MVPFKTYLLFLILILEIKGLSTTTEAVKATSFPTRSLEASSKRSLPWSATPSAHDRILSRYRSSRGNLSSKYLRSQDLGTLGKLAGKFWGYILKHRRRISTWISNFHSFWRRYQSCVPGTCGKDLSCWIKETFCLINKLVHLAKDLSGLSRRQRRQELRRIAKKWVARYAIREYKVYLILAGVINKL